MRTPIHQRSYDCEAFDEGDGLMRVRGHLNDTKPLGLGLADGDPLVIHDMTIDLIVEVPGFEIVAVESQMQVHPYQLCSEVLPDYQQLVGLSIARGYSRKVKELFGGPSGCAHMGALLQAMGPVAIQASWSLINLHADPADRLDDNASAEERERRARMNANTCHVWGQDGPLIGAIERGESPRRPAWEVERLTELGVDLTIEQA